LTTSFFLPLTCRSLSLSVSLDLSLSLSLSISLSLFVTSGGGTPTLLSEKHLSSLLTALQPLLQHRSHQLLLRHQPSLEPSFLSIETTPEIAATELSKLHLLHSFGVRRISVGIQTSSSALLSKINRTTSSSSDLVTTALTNLHQVGFERISLDLIFGLPNQTLEQWKADLQRVVLLSPHSITTYDCVYKGKGRGVNSLMQREELSRPSMELYGRMYDTAYDYLLSHGYHAPYGSLNFSKFPHETGTSSYFEKRLLRGVPYIGLGNYSSSLIDRYWLFAPHSIEAWTEALDSSSSSLSLPQWPHSNSYSLPLEERMSKYLLASLSFGFLDENYFEAAFPSWTLQNFFQESLEELVERRGWLVYTEKERRYYLKEGCFHSLTQIRALFHTERSMAWYESNVLERGQGRGRGGKK
jgi:oxygen-independent coproporphyrinogen III oxidase